MNDIWQLLRERRQIDEEIRDGLEKLFGKKGKSALDAVGAGRVKKYRDFFVVEGRTAAYIVEEDFCTCSDFLFRQRTCWHILAVRIAREAHLFVPVDRWYQETLEKGT